MRVNDQEVKFNVFKAIKFPNNVELYFWVNRIDDAVNEVVLGSGVSDPFAVAELCIEKTSVILHGIIPNQEANPG